MKIVGVLLAGCGVYDGAEIQEAVLTLLALDRAGVEVLCIAPDMEQHHVINHLTGEVMEEKRNVLVEAARIARGNILNISEISGYQLDALIVPGGFGAAKNLSTFAFEGEHCVIHTDVARLIRELHELKKPIGMICIAPVIAGRLFGPNNVKITIGDDLATIQILTQWGAEHINCTVCDIVGDEAHQLITTPAYMRNERIRDVAIGIDALVKAVLDKLG
jgi:enhancing lycopene biosynthesis protein 2